MGTAPGVGGFVYDGALFVDGELGFYGVFFLPL